MILFYQKSSFVVPMAPIFVYLEIYWAESSFTQAKIFLGKEIYCHLPLESTKCQNSCHLDLKLSCP